LSAAREVIASHSDPRSAWHAFFGRGLLPEAWRNDTRRQFPALGDRNPWERDQALRRAPYVPTAGHPDDTATCVLFAADVDGIEHAEASGRAFFAALGQWGVPAPTTVVWVPTSLRHYEYQLHDTKPDVWEPDALLFRLFDVRWEDVVDIVNRLREGAAPSLGDAAFEAARIVGPYLYAEEHWIHAARERWRTDLPNPFSHALEVFQAGYALMPSSDDKLVLGYPLDADVRPPGVEEPTASH
jgi:hypothetical protein